MTDTPQPDSTRAEERCPTCGSDDPKARRAGVSSAKGYCSCYNTSGCPREDDCVDDDTVRCPDPFHATPTPREDAVEEALTRLERLHPNPLFPQAYKDWGTVRKHITSLRSERDQLRDALHAAEPWLGMMADGVVDKVGAATVHGIVLHALANTIQYEARKEVQ